MGQFSWMYCDTDNKRNLRVGGKAYVLLPDGGYIEETCYDGYGNFGGKDIFDLVIDWNRKDLTVEKMEKPKREQWSNEDLYNAMVKQYERYERFVQILEDCRSLSDEEMTAKYKNPEWKRNLGIDIACYDEDNAILRYPIKISSKPCSYEAMPPSNVDTHQGSY